MSPEKGFTRITELVSALTTALHEMEHGRLGAQGLERTTDDARELYERLIVLRHKVREARAAMAAKATGTTPAPAPAQPRPKQESSGHSAIRLDTRPPDPHARQTSLIDAIAEHEEDPAAHPVEAEPKQEPAAAEAVKPAAQPPKEEKAPSHQPVAPPTPASASKASSLAEKLEQAPIADLGKAITLSQKFLFLAELFEGQAPAYDKAIDTINGYKVFDEAKQYVDKEVLAKLKKSPDPETVTSFMELVERRFK